MWVLIDKKLDEYGRFSKVELCGSIQAIQQQKIILNGQEMTDNQLYNRLSKERFWHNERYFIKECKLITSKPKKWAEYQK